MKGWKKRLAKVPHKGVTIVVPLLVLAAVPLSVLSVQVQQNLGSDASTRSENVDVVQHVVVGGKLWSRELKNHEWSKWGNETSSLRGAGTGRVSSFHVYTHRDGHRQQHLVRRGKVWTRELKNGSWSAWVDVTNQVSGVGRGIITGFDVHNNKDGSVQQSLIRDGHVWSRELRNHNWSKWSDATANLVGVGSGKITDFKVYNHRFGYLQQHMVRNGRVWARRLENHAWTEWKDETNGLRSSGLRAGRITGFNSDSPTGSSSEPVSSSTTQQHLVRGGKVWHREFRTHTWSDWTDKSDDVKRVGKGEIASLHVYEHTNGKTQQHLVRGGAIWNRELRNANRNRWTGWQNVTSGIAHVGEGEVTGFDVLNHKDGSIRQRLVRGGELWSRQLKDHEWSNWRKSTSEVSGVGSGEIRQFVVHYDRGGILRQHLVRGGKLWARSYQNGKWGNWSNVTGMVSDVGAGAITGFNSFVSE